MAMNFTASTDDSIYHTNSFTPPTSGTICMWVKRDSVGSVQTLFYVEDNFKIEFHSDDTVKTTLFRHAAKATESITELSTTGVWNHIACYYTDGGVNGIVINGDYDTSDTQSTGTVTPDKIYYACAGLYNEHFDGSLDDIRIYNRVLSLVEIKNITESRGHDGIVKGLLHRFMLSEKHDGEAATIYGIEDWAGSAALTRSYTPTYEASLLTPRRMV